MNCLNWLQLSDSSNKVAIVAIIVVVALLILVGYFGYRRAMSSVLSFGAARKNADALPAADTENVASKKPSEEEEQARKMVYSVA